MTRASQASEKQKLITVRVKFLAHFPQIFGGKERLVRLPVASRAGQLLRCLGDTDRRRRELMSGERLNAQVVVLKNGISIRSLKGLATSLADGDTVAIFPFLAGG
jgi:molybdopterin synthase sulfur carrier subunit